MEVVELQPGQDGSLLDIAGADEGVDSDGGGDSKKRLLGYLDKVQEVVVRQQRDMLETLRGTEEPNVYFIYDKVTGDKLYHIQEKVDCCQQICIGGGNRGFNITIYDKFNRPIIELKRSNACCYGGCCPFLGCFSCLDRVKVYVRDYTRLPIKSNHVGSVKQNWNPVFPSFSILDEYDDVQYYLTGPVITSGCFANVVFRINDPKSGREVGQITKDWAGVCTEYTSDTDLFSIKFPAGDVDEKVKATLLAALIFIDFKYFEENKCQCSCTQVMTFCL